VRNVSQSFTRFMPRVLLSYSPNQQLNVYGSWALSYLQGSDTNAFTYAQRVPQAGIDPNDFGVFTPVQRLSAFEIGVKAAPMNNLSFSIAGYYMDWQNQVQFELSPTFVALFSAGDSRYKGIEAEVTYAPVNWLILEGNFNYVDATLTRFNGAGSTANAVLFPGLLAGQQISSVGNRPRYIPEWSGALAGTLRFGRMFDLERDVNLRVDGVYFGQIFEDNFEYNSITGFWRFNARFSTEVTKQLRVDLYGLNLTNNLNFTSAGGTTNGTLGNTVPFQTRKTFGTLPRAREVGLEVLFKF
jgi:iron complex outermembrane receptor protein